MSNLPPSGGPSQWFPVAPPGAAYVCAKEWAAARRAFLALPANAPGAKAALARLANAEDALARCFPAGK